MMAKRTRDNWRRGNGLWLPERPEMLVPRGMGRLPATVREWGGGCFAGCCETEPPACNCDCENCAPIEGQYINNAPCCWQVKISGITTTDPVDCGTCNYFNRTYYLSQRTPGECIWSTTVSAPCTQCAEVDLTLELSGTTFILTLGNHVWSRDYGTPPNCCTISNYSLTHQTSSGDCDSTQASATITATTRSATNCPACTGECAGSEHPVRLVLDIGEVGWSSGDYPYHTCGECVNVGGEYTMTLYGSYGGAYCNWCGYHIPRLCTTSSWFLNLRLMYGDLSSYLTGLPPGSWFGYAFNFAFRSSLRCMDVVIPMPPTYVSEILTQNAESYTEYIDGDGRLKLTRRNEWQDMGTICKKTGYPIPDDPIYAWVGS